MRLYLPRKPHQPTWPESLAPRWLLARRRSPGWCHPGPPHRHRVARGPCAATDATINLDSVSIATANVLTVAGSNNVIQRVDAALTSVSGLRSTFGAIQNRFESVIANLTTTSENLSASRSRIQDADFAQETANLSRAQILQQAGTAMVAQANQLPQGVLALLRQ